MTPASRWKGGNGPEETDLVSFRNLLRVMPKSLKRVVFTSSAGVERAGSFPYSILNLFGNCTTLNALPGVLWDGGRGRGEVSTQDLPHCGCAITLNNWALSRMGSQQ